MMDSCGSTEADLRIPAKCIRCITKRRAVCLVTEGWLKAAVNRKPCGPDLALWQSLTPTECSLLLAQSNTKLNRPWIRISVKIINKSNKMVESFLEMPLCRDNSGDTYTEVMAAVHRENFENLWQQASEKYAKANIAEGLKKPGSKRRAQVAVIRELLEKTYSCGITKIGNQPKEYITQASLKSHSQKCSNSHPNIVDAYSILESERAFYVLQPYSLYTLHDCVTFSPAKLAGSFSKPLFILFQILQGIHWSHQMGLSIGDLRLCDIMIDDKLWLNLCFPPMQRAYRQLDQSNSSCKQTDGDEICDRDQRSLVPVDAAGQNTSYGQYTLSDLSNLVQMWVKGELSNFDYLMILNHLAGRRMGDPDHHPVLPWVMDFTSFTSGYRDLSRTKFRLNKGDPQLDLTYETTSPFDDSQSTTSLQIPHHISDFLSDITYYVYKARQIPKSVLCANVRSKWVPNEYPSSMQRMQEWTPDECIPEFFTDPEIFTSIHNDLPDLEIPSWADSVEDFIEKHMSVLEGEYVSQRLNHWIDLTFGYKLSGNAAVKAKNVCLQLVDQHSNLTNYGVVQLFNQPHPPRQLRSFVATRAPPQFRRPPSMAQLQDAAVDKEASPKRDYNSLEKKRNESGGSECKSTLRPEDASIILPRGFDPLALLDQVESLYNFSAKATHQLPSGGLDKELQRTEYAAQLVTQDMQAFGCVLVELFLSPRLRVLGPEASLAERYKAIRKLCQRSMEELPRPVRHAVKRLLQPQKEWSMTDHKQDDSFSPIFTYDIVSDVDGLPPPTTNQLLHPYRSPLPFPPYFPKLHRLLQRMKVIDTDLYKLQFADVSTPNDRFLKMRALNREKVSLVSRFVMRNARSIGAEGVELLLPYIQDLLADPMTAAQTAWSTFNPLAQALGPQITCEHLLPNLTAILDGEFSTVKHMKLYHRSFCIQLLIRLGVQPFLQHFSTLLIEACAGYKDFSGDDAMDRQISNEADFEFDSDRNNIDYPEVFDMDEGLRPSPDGRILPVSVGEEAYADELSLEEELQASGDHEKNSSDSGSADPSGDDHVDTRSVTSIELSNVAEGNTDSVSVGSMDVSDDVLGRSLGRLSVHSISRLIPEDQMGQESETGEDGLQIARRPSGGSVSEQEVDDNSDDKAESVVAQSVVQSETEFSRSNMDSVEYNISDVAAETIKWLVHRLGPVLTAKYLSRNLLRMLALCYLGDEQLEPITKIGDTLSTTNKHVVGDMNASQVLDCLSCIAVLYGEHVIILQYFPHMRELIMASQKRFSLRAEAGLISCIVLLIHILPYLSDSTLMDILQDVLFKDFLLPLLKQVSSLQVAFPSGSRARRLLCYKIIDALYIISLRIGFEMTRQLMTFVLQKFFASFNRVYDENFLKAKPEEKSTPVIEQPDTPVKSKSENMYFELKLDSETKEYKISDRITPERRHTRQSSGTFRYTLSPPMHEEKAVSEDTEPTETGSQEKIYQEMLETFTPEMAHTAYIPFCKLAGGIHMEQNLINDDLIRQLCSVHDDAMSKQQPAALSRNLSLNSWSSQELLESSTDDDPDVVGSGFGRNVSIAGNKIVVHSEDNDGSVQNGKVSRSQGRSSCEAPLDLNKLHSPEMEVNKHRHLKGNWLAYWEHELGLRDRDTSFNFKQIKLLTFTGHTSSVRALHVMDNENSFISASKDKTVRLWSLRSSGDGNTRCSSQWVYHGHKKSVFAVTFLESPRLAASCDGTVHVWDPFVGVCVRQYETQRNSPVSVMSALPPPHSTILTATSESTLRFYDLRSPTFTHELKCSSSPSGLIRCMGVSPDSHWVAVGYSSGLMSLLDVRTGMLFASWKGHEGEVLQVRALNTKNVVTSSLDQCLGLWNVDDAKLVTHLKGPTDPVHCFSVYRNEIISASTGNRIGVHSSIERQPTYTSTKLRSDGFRGVVTTMAVLPENKLLLLGADNGLIRLLA